MLPNQEIAGRCSFAVLLTVGPTFSGVDHGSEVRSRLATHRSRPPRLPGRLDKKKSSNPSLRETVWNESPRLLLSAGTSVGGENVPSAAILVV